MPRLLWRSLGGAAVSYERGTPVPGSGCWGGRNSGHMNPRMGEIPLYLVMSEVPLYLVADVRPVETLAEGVLDVQRQAPDHVLLHLSISSFNLELAGNEVYYTNTLILLI